jgi:hypothetical protein
MAIFAYTAPSSDHGFGYLAARELSREQRPIPLQGC